MRMLLAVLSLCASGSLAAEISNLGDHQFTVSHVITTEARPAVVYRTMTSHIDQWWNGDHSWSSDAENLYMKVERGGCFGEKLPGGGRVEHLRLIYFAPDRELRFNGALGPLQTLPVQGRMMWKIEAIESGSEIRFTYHVFGHPEGGLQGIAPAVDGVIGEQLKRLGERLSW